MVTAPAVQCQRGFSLLEGILGLSLLMGLMALGGQHAQRRLEERLCENAATHLSTVVEAATRYVLDGYGRLGAETEKEQWQQAQQQAADTDRHSLETWRYQQLIDQHYLPDYFNPQNLYGQHYAVYITSETTPQPRKQLLVLTTRGRPIGEQALRQAARRLGSQGGYLSSQEKNPDNEYCITGSQRGWQLPLPVETAYQPPERPENPEEAQPSHHSPGHLASVTLLYEDDVLRSSSMLHRTAVPGQPQLNQMESDLAMQQHQIVFKDSQYSGALSAQTMELAHGSSGASSSSSSSEVVPSSVANSKLSLHCGASGPKITLKQEGEELAITSDQVQFSGVALPKEWQETVKAHSPSELHRYWNKLPYYELSGGISQSATGQFANQVCSTEISTHSEKYSTIGRLFLIGFTEHPVSHLYICRHTPQNTRAPTQAHLIDRLGSSLTQDAKDGLMRTAKTAVDAALTTKGAVTWLSADLSITGVQHSGEIVAGTAQQVAEYASEMVKNTAARGQNMVLIPYKKYQQWRKNSENDPPGSDE